MSIEHSKALVTRFGEEFWNRGDLAAADALTAAAATIHMPTGEVVNPAGLQAFARTWRGAFPDWQATCEELIAEGDAVAERWTGRGTHRGALQGIAATGTQVEVPGTVFYRIVGDKIVEFRGQFDVLGLMRQLGALPQDERVGV
jgi:predicted ester cyclase